MIRTLYPLLTILPLFAFLGSCGTGDGYTNKIKKNRIEKRKHFKYADASPLTNEQKKDFDNLNYFSINPQFRVKAKVDRLANKDTFEMAYKNGSNQKYFRFARLSFELKGEDFELYAYKNVDPSRKGSKNPLFIPFYDKSNGQSTYGGGRYLDVKMKNVNDSLVLDFNKAYNPYCAYNDQYACPVPPKENKLNVSITAGEKAFSL